MAQIKKHSIIFIIVISLISIKNLSFAQSKRIHYYLPPQVDSVLYRYCKNNSNKKYFAIMAQDSLGYEVMMVPYYKKDKAPDAVIALKSSRWLRLSGTVDIPVFIWGFDNTFVDQDYKKLPNGEILSHLMSIDYHCFIVRFKYGSIVYMGNG